MQRRCLKNWIKMRTNGNKIYQILGIAMNANNAYEEMLTGYADPDAT